MSAVVAPHKIVTGRKETNCPKFYSRVRLGRLRSPGCLRYHRDSGSAKSNSLGISLLRKDPRLGRKRQIWNRCGWCICATYRPPKQAFGPRHLRQDINSLRKLFLAQKQLIRSADSSPTCDIVGCTHYDHVCADRP